MTAHTRLRVLDPKRGVIWQGEGDVLSRRWISATMVMAQHIFQQARSSVWLAAAKQRRACALFHARSGESDLITIQSCRAVTAGANVDVRGLRGASTVDILVLQMNR